MSKPNWLTLSLSVNLLLAAAVAVFSQLHQTPPVPKVRILKKTVIKTERAAATNPVSIPDVVPAGPFHWRQVESSDFPTYTANLRKIGCPAATIRDIITADVDEMYVQKRQDILAPLENQFWEIVANNGLDHLPKAEEDKLEALEKEKDALLKKLLGKEIEPKSEPISADPTFESEMADVITKEKRDALHALGVKLQQQLTEVSTNKSLSQDERQAKTTELHKQTRAAQEALLSPDELAEFKLRKSRAADEVNSLNGFDGSEDELRQIAQIKNGIDRKSPQVKEQTDAANAQIKQLLGDERFATYERAADPNFSDIYNLGQRYELPTEVMTDVYQMKLGVLKEAKTIRNNKSLSDDDRQNLLDAMQAETERAVSATLGANVYKTYKKHGGEWIEQMADR